MVCCVHGDTARHGNGKHGSRAGSASRCHGMASGCQCGHSYHVQARTGEIETLALELIAVARKCARNSRPPEQIQSESNMVDLGTTALEKDTSD